MSNAIVTFTARALEEILATGGSKAWVLDRNHARQQEYLVCTRNAHGERAKGSEPHGSAFLVGRISDIVPSTESDPNRRWQSDGRRG